MSSPVIPLEMPVWWLNSCFWCPIRHLKIALVGKLTGKIATERMNWRVSIAMGGATPSRVFLLVVSSLVVNCGFTSFAPSIAVCFTTMNDPDDHKSLLAQLHTTELGPAQSWRWNYQSSLACNMWAASGTPLQLKRKQQSRPRRLERFIGSIGSFPSCDFKPFPKENSHWHYNHYSFSSLAPGCFRPGLNSAREVWDSPRTERANTGWVRCFQELCKKKKWVCLKIGYIPNYSHLIGIMIINQWV